MKRSEGREVIKDRGRGAREEYAEGRKGRKKGGNSKG